MPSTSISASASLQFNIFCIYCIASSSYMRTLSGSLDLLSVVTGLTNACSLLKPSVLGSSYL